MLVRSISGGYAQGMRKKSRDKRPWHLHLTSAGTWELWMDAERAAAIRGARYSR